MQERIVVENFGGLIKAEIDLKKINIFIGPQASGKSVLAKLIYYFKEIPNGFKSAYFDNSPPEVFHENLTATFKKYFPIHTHPLNGFNIVYEGKTYYNIKRDEKHLFFEDHSNLDKYLLENSHNYDSKKPLIVLATNNINSLFAKMDEFKKLLTDNPELEEKELVFIPAGRVLFASIQSNIYSFLNSKINLDPFLIKFGQNYQQITDYKTDSHPEEYAFSPLNNNQDILSGNYLRENDKDYLVHSDGRKINIAYASSGQQESLPLVLMLNYLQIINSNKVVVFIEEPEAHLFPSAQKKIVELIAATFNANPERDIQFVITTHSPYILTSFNNLIQAGQLANTLPKDSLEKLYNIVPQNQLLHIEDIAAYAVADGTATDIIDKENNLIDARIIDAVSNDIAIQFDSLLDLQ